MYEGAFRKVFGEFFLTEVQFQVKSETKTRQDRACIIYRISRIEAALHVL